MELAKKKRKQEKEMINKMIRLTCRKHHGKKHSLCDECQRLMDYAEARIDNCPFILTKSFCSRCQVHCYAPAQRDKIRQVMRYSGPRMIWHDPIMVIHHGLDTLVNQMKQQNDKKK